MNYNGNGINRHGGNLAIVFRGNGGSSCHDDEVIKLAIDRKVRMVELVLRAVLCGLGVVSAALVGSNSQVKVIFSVQKKARFTDMKALVFLVVANGMVAAYSLVQIVRCVVSIVRGSVLSYRPSAWVIFSADQVMAYMTLAALAAAAQSSVTGKFGQQELQWMKICDMYGKFCNQTAKNGIASALIVALCSALVSAISAYNLFRLYGTVPGNNKGNISSRW